MKLITPSICLLLLSLNAFGQIKAEVIDRGTTIGKFGDLLTSDHATLTQYSKGNYILSCSEWTENILNMKSYDIKINNKQTLNDFYSLLIRVANDKKEFKFSINAGETIYLEYFSLTEQITLTASKTGDTTKKFISVKLQRHQINDLFGKSK